MTFDTGISAADRCGKEALKGLFFDGIFRRKEAFPVNGAGGRRKTGRVRIRSQGAHVPAARPPELCGASAPQACRQARSAPPASSAAFPQQRRVRLQSTKKKELASIKKGPFRGLLLCSRCLPLHDLRAEHYALVYSVSSQYVQDRLCRRHALVIQHIIQRRQCRRGHLRIKRVVDPDH